MDKISSLVPSFARRGSTISTTSTTSDPDLAKPLKTATRPRSLSIPLANPQKVGIRRVKQQTFDQNDSLLFKLPFELREQIYRFVLGGKCVAADASGNRIGDRSDPWPDYEKPGGHRRGLRPWGWVPLRSTNMLSLLCTCRQAYVISNCDRAILTKWYSYSEAIDILYYNNMFYFRDPITNWTFSKWRILPQRVEQVRVLVLDETIGDPNIIFTNRKHWNRIWRTIAKMTRLKILYFNVDTLYPRAWTAELEKRLLAPLTAITQANEMYVILKWSKPAEIDTNDHPRHVREAIRRIGDYELPDQFYKACQPAEMQTWISKTLALLESGAVLSRKDSLMSRTV